MIDPSTSPEAVPPAPPARIYSLAVWGLAAGYFVFYAPYSSLVRAMSRGLVPGVPTPSSPLVALPVIGLTTAIVATLIVTALGWWRHGSARSIGQWRVPWPGRRMVVAGVATAAIIYTTTLMFMFAGVSIVLALLIMRGGVLVLAPLMDFAFGRRVRWFAWTGFALAIVAVATVASGGKTLQIGWATAATAGLYLLGYVFRLPAVNTGAKSRDVACNCRYFVDELLVAMATLVAAPLLLALLGNTVIAVTMREGLSTFLTTRTVWLAIAIGALYACLYVFGTLVYLDRRENTFCVALNRGSSVLAGLVGTAGLAVIAGEPWPGTYELAAATAILCAIVILSPAHHAMERLWAATPELSPEDEPVAGLAMEQPEAALVAARAMRVGQGSWR